MNRLHIGRSRYLGFVGGPFDVTLGREDAFNTHHRAFIPPGKRGLILSWTWLHWRYVIVVMGRSFWLRRPKRVLPRYES